MRIAPHLPQEMVEQCLQYLAPFQLRRAGQTNRLWRSAAEHVLGKALAPPRVTTWTEKQARTEGIGRRIDMARVQHGLALELRPVGSSKSYEGLLALCNGIAAYNSYRGTIDWISLPTVGAGGNPTRVPWDPKQHPALRAAKWYGSAAAKDPARLCAAQTEVSTDGRRLALLRSDGAAVYRYEKSSPHLERLIAEKSELRQFHDLAFFPDSDHLVLTNKDAIQTMNLRNGGTSEWPAMGNCKLHLVPGRRELVASMTYTSYETFDDHLRCVTSIDAGEQAQKEAASPTTGHMALFYQPRWGDGPNPVARLRLLNPRTGASQTLAGVPEALKALQFSLDGRWLAALNHCGKVLLWDLQRSLPIPAPAPAPRRNFRRLRALREAILFLKSPLDGKGRKRAQLVVDAAAVLATSPDPWHPVNRMRDAVKEFWLNHGVFESEYASSYLLGRMHKNFETDLRRGRFVEQLLRGTLDAAFIEVRSGTPLRLRRAARFVRAVVDFVGSQHIELRPYLVRLEPAAPPLDYICAVANTVRACKWEKTAFFNSMWRTSNGAWCRPVPQQRNRCT